MAKIQEQNSITGNKRTKDAMDLLQVRARIIYCDKEISGSDYVLMNSFARY